MRGTASLLAWLLASAPSTGVGEGPSEAIPPAPSLVEPAPEPAQTGAADAELPGQLSQDGTRHGALEIGLGVVLSGAAAGLVAFGAVQLVRAREHVGFCQQSVDVISETPESGGGIDPCVFDPPPLGFASAGLSWGFAIPIAVGAGLLFARARRVRADARAFEALHPRAARLRASGWGRRDAGGLTLELRF